MADFTALPLSSMTKPQRYRVKGPMVNQRPEK